MIDKSLSKAANHHVLCSKLLLIYLANNAHGSTQIPPYTIFEELVKLSQQLLKS